MFAVYIRVYLLVNYILKDKQDKAHILMSLDFLTARRMRFRSNRSSFISNDFTGLIHD